jgi:hypothetical protein
VKTEHITNMVCEHGGLRGKCEVCEITAERDMLRRQVGAVETERTVIANQYAELSEIFRGPHGQDHDWVVSNAANTVAELYEMTEERNGMRQERDLLRRQVDAMANDMARTAPPENYPNYYDDWLELLWAERVQWWVKWSLEQAKGGG